MQVFENFISYRRKDSSLEVRNIYDALIKKGYSTFCDVYSLKSGNFDENIKEIEKAYGVGILCRGTQIKISGEPEKVSLAGKAVQSLLIFWNRRRLVPL